MPKFKADKEISNGPRRKKNRSKFCGGKEGKLHQPVWILHNSYSVESLIYECTICHKHIDYWFGWWDRVHSNYQKPEVGSTEPKRKKI